MCSSIFSAEKQGGRWRGDDYGFLLEQGLMMSGRLDDLILAATGRVYAAINSGQKHFDDAEHGHLRMLSDILATIVLDAHWRRILKNRKQGSISSLPN